MMHKKRTSNIIKILTISISIFTILSCIFYQYYYEKKIKYLNYVDNGIVYYKNKNDKQNLYGNWEFYYNDLIIDDNINRTSDGYMEVPGFWYYKENGNYDIYGCASYKCTLKNVPKGEVLTIGFDNLSIAYKIYINNQLVAENGDLIKEELKFSELLKLKNYGDQLSYNYYTNEIDNNDLEIVIEVFSINKGGIYKVPTIFYNKSNINFTNNKIIQKSIILGMLIIATIIHLLYIIINKNFKTQILPFIVEILLITYSICSGTFYASLSRELNLFNAEYVDIFIFILDFIIIILISIIILDKKRKKRNILGMTMILLSFILFGLYQYVKRYSDKNFDNILEGLIALRSIVLIISFVFFFKKERHDSSVYFVKISIASLTITEYFKIINNLGLVYFGTRNSETIFIFLTLLFSLISYFIIQSRYQKAAKDNNDLLVSNTNYKINLLLNQIKPHFLYNTLNSINILCKIDPNEASNAIVLFSSYLRNNMDSISETNLISISKELEHVKTYVGIEKMRFRDRLEVEFNIESKDFTVPPLSIQALTENAIKHGVNTRINGVKVIILTWSDNEYNYISIKDNGVGFNINNITESDSVGLSNIIKRIGMLCPGELSIRSNNIDGTVITLKLKR